MASRSPDPEWVGALSLAAIDSRGAWSGWRPAFDAQRFRRADEFLRHLVTKFAAAGNYLPASQRLGTFSSLSIISDFYAEWVVGEFA
jgi:hypothetical protein